MRAIERGPSKTTGDSEVMAIIFFVAAACPFFMAACLFMAAGSFSPWLWFKRFRDLSQIPDLSPDVRQINRRNKEMKCVYRLVLCGWGGENGLGEVQYDIVFPYCNSEHK